MQRGFIQDCLFLGEKKRKSGGATVERKDRGKWTASEEMGEHGMAGGVFCDIGAEREREREKLVCVFSFSVFRVRRAIVVDEKASDFFRLPLGAVCGARGVYHVSFIRKKSDRPKKKSAHAARERIPSSLSSSSERAGIKEKT